MCHEERRAARCAVYTRAVNSIDRVAQVLKREVELPLVSTSAESRMIDLIARRTTIRDSVVDLISKRESVLRLSPARSELKIKDALRTIPAQAHPALERRDP